MAYRLAKFAPHLDEPFIGSQTNLAGRYLVSVVGCVEQGQLQAIDELVDQDVIVSHGGSVARRNARQNVRFRPVSTAAQ
jgi:hypothetical protein